MRGVEMVLLYLLVGLGCGVAAALRTEARPWLEALLLVPFWPLLGPFALGRQAATGPSAAASPEGPVAAGFLGATGRAAGTPLEALLPDAAEARALVRRLELGAAKVAECDRLLALPEFLEAAARERHRELLARGEHTAAEAALRRAAHLGRLKALRDRWASELEAVGELIAQLRVQTEVARLAGAGGDATAALVDELVSRVEGLDAVLEEEALFAG